MRALRIRRKKAAVITVVVFLVAIIGLAGVIGATRSRSGDDGGGSAFLNSAPQPLPLQDGSLADQDKSRQMVDEATAGAEQGGSSGAGVNGTLPPLQNPGQYLIRSGSLTLVVGRDRVDDSVASINAITRAYNGYILSSTVGTLPSNGGVTPYPVPLEDQAVNGGQALDERLMTTVEGGEPYAYVTVRIPAARFDDALARFQQLGKVRSLDTSTEDVTSQIVDLRARLRHYQAVEERLLSFLDKAKTVGAALAVQDRIDQTQVMVEEIKAQLKQLDETVTYSTLSISMTETAKAGVIDQSDSFWGAIKHSLTLVGDGFRWIAVALGAVLPFLVVLAVVGGVTFWLVRRSVRQRRLRAGQSGPGAPGGGGPAAAAGGEAT